MKEDDRSTTRREYPVLIAGSLLFLLGITVSIGWHTRTAMLLRLSPLFVPMHYNTALGFLLCGLGLLARAFRKWRLTLACGAAVALIGLLSFLQYAFAVNLGIDQLLMNDFITVGTLSPGRMGPVTALCFALAGAALVLTARWNHRLNSTILAVLGALIGAPGSVAMIAYIFGTESLCGWGSSFRIAAHTAAGLVILGTAFFVPTQSDNCAEGSALLRWLFLVGLVISLSLSYALRGRERLQIENQTQQAAQNFKINVRERMEERVRALLRMAWRWEIRRGTPRDEWEADAALLVAQQAGYETIEWVDPSLQVRWVAPFGASSAILGGGPDPDQRRRQALEEARARRGVRLMGPVELAHGGSGFIACVPVFASDQFYGFIVGTLSTQHIFSSEELGHDYSLAVFSGDEEIYRRIESDGNQIKDLVAGTEITYRNLAWRTQIWPTMEHVAESQSALPLAVLIVGFSVTALMTLAFHFAQTARCRTREVEAATHRLRGEIVQRQHAEEELTAVNNTLEQRVVERTQDLDDARLAALDLWEEARQAKSKAEQAQELLERKNRDLETLLFVTSHDLREPLRAISNFSRLVHERYADRLDAKGKDFLARVVRAAQRLDTLLSDVLSLSRAQRLEPPKEEIDGRAIVRSALARLEEKVQQSGAAVRIAEDLPRLRVDKVWATQAIYNLLANALKFTTNGERPDIEIAPYTGNGEAGIIVRDRGPGVVPEHAERIFQLFQRAVGRDVDGTGAGLAIVRQVAERHGGRAWVQPRADGGAEFVVTFGNQPSKGGA